VYVNAAPNKTKKPKSTASTVGDTADKSGSDGTTVTNAGTDSPEPVATSDVTTPVTTDPTTTTTSNLAPAAATTSTVVKTEVPKLPWTQEITGKRIAMAYEPIREADVFWRKDVWRVIDLREKINLHFRWPKAPFIQILLDAIKEGRAQVYSDDEFSAPMEPKDALALGGGGFDTVSIYNPETGLTESKPVEKVVNWDNVKKLRVKEVWFFNKQTSTMQVRIMGVCPLMDNYTTDPITGDEIYRGEVSLFWIYFPTIRQTLVNSEAYNPFPNGVRLNWDQVFALRLFGSYIYKVDNVQDFRIKDYKSGIDILYESEAKKQELFNFEHDLWEY
jgi:gliding motility associated protien GldN